VRRSPDELANADIARDDDRVRCHPRTAAYMSPEAGEGEAGRQTVRRVGVRCVLYEMLTANERSAARMRPTSLQQSCAPNRTGRAAGERTAPIRRLLRRCLEKDRQRRLADAADARLEIDDALAAPSVEALAVAPPGAFAPVAIAALVVGATITALVGWFLTRNATPPPCCCRGLASCRRRAADEESTRPAQPCPLADGRHLVYISTFGAGGGQLAVRDIDQVEPRLIDGVTNARSLSFPPIAAGLGSSTAMNSRKCR